ncbi:MAG: hypothetical protein A2X35_09995 [Elusimicrobia bacterium GWA2_61_42]|nr:MAG: hypothetical protein A2X35_09995 [Elusimicrobia bacterium GWA2_61_42]OGR74883.1 MAG: hypothetical protein A2X38_08910 [Elusimicrobia bacterium GWC2_61_25]
MKTAIKALLVALLPTYAPLCAPAGEARPDFREETIYFVLTDRFADGDPANNDIYGDEYRPGNLRYYQGGDFKGLMANLDHIKKMGFSAVWLTPPVLQPPGRYVNSAGTYDAAGYHGYWAWDFSRIDPHLESPGATYKDLIAAAHAQGLKIIQDVVLNHGHGGDAAPGVKWHARRGQLSGLGKTFDYYDDKEKWFNHAGPALADLLDLDDKNPEVLKWFTEIYGGYQDLGVDAFRLDTVAWMDKAFWKKFTAAMRARKPDFFIFGEVWTNDDYALLGSYTRLARGGPMRAGMSIMDMPGSSMGGWGRLEKVFKGGDYAGVDEVLRHDGAYADASWLVTFLDNHDKPRFNGPAGGTPAAAEQYLDALNFYFTARGIPCVYYGTEVMLPGGDEPDNRRMLGAEGIKSAANSPVYARLRELNAVRRASPALQKGSQKKLYAQKDQYVFRRDYGKSRAFVFLNKAAYPARLTIPAVPDGTYTELYTGARVTVKRGAVMEVPPHGVRVLAN